MGFYCGVDIGGTFTDCIIVDDEGRISIAKASSTPPEYEEGFLAAVAEGAKHYGRTLEEFLPDCELILHGTTNGTNALVQMRGARTGLITTRGHRDALIMMRSAGRSAGLAIEQLLHVSRHRKPDPIVPRHMIREVSERVDWSGRILLPLNEVQAVAAVRELLERDVESIAISFLWGFVNTAHERRMRAIVEQLAPHVYVCCAHELIAKPGEYERTAGAAVNAYIGPVTSSYVHRLDRGLRQRGYANQLLIMQAAGGVVPAKSAIAAPLFTIGSGPVGGVMGAKVLADRLGHQNVIASDMGGTSFDVGILRAGEPLRSSETIVNQYTFYMPRLLIESIGAGGGSIIWVDGSSRTLRVGPESAGARPGPACYGRGGTRPATSDADLLLGYLNPHNFLGGRLRLDRDAALEAMRTVAEPLGMDPVEAAAGAVRIVDHHMGDLMRQMTVGQGLDPRDFVVYAYGGAGPVHASGYARELGCEEIVIPLGDFAAGWSALGVLSSDIVHIYERAHLLSSPFDPDVVNATFQELEEQARRQLLEDGLAEDAIALVRSVEMKFSLQIHQVIVPVPAGTLDVADLAALTDAFMLEYESIYGTGSAYTAAGIQIGVMRVTGWGRIRRPELALELRGTGFDPVGSRDAYWEAYGGFRETPVYDGPSLPRGANLVGPAIVEMPETTIVVQPDDRLRVDDLGNIIIRVPPLTGLPGATKEAIS